jgi:hypothetical protein
MTSSTNFITFHNELDKPVMVESWKKLSGSMYIYQSTDIKIDAGQSMLVESSVGEWKVHIMFSKDNDKEAKKKWNAYWETRSDEIFIEMKAKLGSKIEEIVKPLKYYPHYLGKFRSEPAFDRKYAWSEVNEVDFIRNDNSDIRLVYNYTTEHLKSHTL